MTGSAVRVEAKDGGTFDAYLSRPASGRGPGIVVLQEIFGVNAFVRSIADWLAEQGYFAIAPDLFWRQKAGVELDPEDEADRVRAMGYLKALDQAAATEDACTAAAFLRDIEGSTRKVGAVGYCLGGKISYLLAMRPEIDAAVGYYGVAIQAALGDADRLCAPLLLHMAADDSLCPQDAQQAIATALRPHSVRIETFAGVGHGFARRGSSIYAAGPAAKADAATLAFLEEHLRAHAL